MLDHAAAPCRTQATYQDILDAPEGVVAEIVDGSLRLQPRPRSGHQAVLTALAADLLDPFGRGRGGPGGWVVLIDPEIPFADGDVYVPDIAGWRRERLPKLDPEGVIDTRPDWVCEILSPSTRRFDLGTKRAAYARQGVPFLWFVDPLARRLEALRLEGGDWVCIAAHAGGEVVRVPPFETVGLAMDGWWLG